MTLPVRSLRLQGKNTLSLDNITATTGEVFWDQNDNCLRLYSGRVKGGTRIPTEDTIKDLVRIKLGTPASTSTGQVGELRYDGSYLYVCTAVNTWRRTALEVY